jgi:hypothetical protein
MSSVAGESAARGEAVSVSRLLRIRAIGLIMRSEDEGEGRHHLYTKRLIT